MKIISHSKIIFATLLVCFFLAPSLTAKAETLANSADCTKGVFLITLSDTSGATYNTLPLAIGSTIPNLPNTGVGPENVPATAPNFIWSFAAVFVAVAILLFPSLIFLRKRFNK